MRQIKINRLFLKIRDLLLTTRLQRSASSTKSKVYWAVLGLSAAGCAPAEPIQAVAPEAVTSRMDAGMAAPNRQNDGSLSPSISDAGLSFPDDTTPNLDRGLSTITQDSQVEADAWNDADVEAGVGMDGESSGALTNQASTIAAELDVLCQTDCQKDLACNPTEAEPVAVCVEKFCGYTTNLGTEAVNASLVRCFELERDLLACITALNCDEYIRYYNGDDMSVIPCANPEMAFESACAEFFGDET